MKYLNWDTKTITDFSDKNIEDMYDKGYVFTRLEKGVMNKTRSFRIDLGYYEPSSENRRILRKSEHLSLLVESIPYEKYSWQIGKLAKDFYEKFGDKVFTANKTREIITDEKKSNFNQLFIFLDTRNRTAAGYSICHKAGNMIHYSYPFYIEDSKESSRGLGMMTMAVEWAKGLGKKYIYLGSLQRPSDSYKLQFAGGEWFDGERWRSDYEPLKEILK
jgi:arginyl-tRNA--protein-N-Asp/Glu arginylyltransferase